MSSSIWTRCAGASRVRPLRLTPWRVVEAQHQVSTRKLVDSAQEQELLEELIDGAKPQDVTRGKLHYLVATPFRYPPLRHGSRFGTRHEPGIWYGSETLSSAFAEVAYYRFVFLEGTRATLEPLDTELTSFRVSAHTKLGVDLVAPPFEKHRRVIASPTRYAETQALGAAMRAANVQLVRYPSARDPGRGVNVAAFSPRVFGPGKPRDFQTWHSIATRDTVEIVKRDYFRRETMRFVRTQFLVRGELPTPAF
jgi:hypothetical protein